MIRYATIAIDKSSIYRSTIDSDSFTSQILKQATGSIAEYDYSDLDYDEIAALLSEITGKEYSYDRTIDFRETGDSDLQGLPVEWHLFSADPYGGDPWDSTTVVIWDDVPHVPIDGSLAGSGFYSDRICCYLESFNGEQVELNDYLYLEQIPQRMLQDPIWSQKHDCFVAYDEEIQQPVKIYLECYLGH